MHKVVDLDGLRGAMVGSALWVGVSVAFGVLLWVTRGSSISGQFFSGYLLEKSLSVDNVFAFALLFRNLAVPRNLQRRVLQWGVISALVLRGGFIAGGAALVEHANWAFYVLGLIVLVAGIRMVRGTIEGNPGQGMVLRTLRHVLPISKEYSGAHFFIRDSARLIATPLLVALLSIEVIDLVFATDSIPAIFGVSTNVYVVFTSNAFAVLGLRSLYFVFARAMDQFVYLAKGLAVLLVLIGVKMLLNSIIEIPTAIVLVVIVVLLSISVGASLFRDHHPRSAASGRDRLS